MSKILYFYNKCSEIAKRWGFSTTSAPLTFNIGDQKLRDFAKLCFFKLIMIKSNFKKSLMTSVTLSQLRHRKTSPITSQHFFFSSGYIYKLIIEFWHLVANARHFCLLSH